MGRRPEALQWFPDAVVSVVQGVDERRRRVEAY